MTQVADYDTQRRATELAVKLYDCPVCIAQAGELCYADAGGGRVTRNWQQIHMARFAGLGSPTEFLASQTDRPPR